MSAQADRDRRLAERLRGIRPPGEDEALGRALAVAHEQGLAATSPKHRPLAPRRIAAVCAGLLATAALALTPAGATVTNWIDDAVSPEPAETSVLRAVPSGGSLLVQSPAGSWVVQPDGSRRLLGSYLAASWSPRGLYAAVSGKRELSAVEPGGTPHWVIPTTSRPAGVRWAPSGQRIAYLQGDGNDGLSRLQLVAGDSTGARTLANAVQPVAPAWKPADEGASSPNLLAYVDRYGIVRAIDADSGAAIGEARASSLPSAIVWIGGSRLIAIEHDRVELLELGGVTRTVFRPVEGAIDSAAYSPATGALAVLIRAGGGGRSQSRLVLQRQALNAGATARVLFSGLGRYQGPVFSSDGSRIQLGWPSANQWLFVKTGAGEHGVSTVGAIRHQFDPDGGGGRFPAVSGWCCG
jgi:hypothetical protein